MEAEFEGRKRKLSLATSCKPIDIEWERLTVTSIMKQNGATNGANQTQSESKVILNDISGSIKHGKFTAILGPSGCGKTTLLNFLAGRIDNKLQIQGDFRVNSQSVPDIDFIGNLVAFVQQDDILFPTLTPREIFTFAANLRLNLSREKKTERVEQIIAELDIAKCSNTRVGTAEVRGLSGGERKRTSIGVDLITNPSLIFLDEPTTGLDSTTALNVLEVLQRLSRSGRNVVSTIHQPSSEIFNKFDNLILIVRGSIIYQGLATQAVRYFGEIGFPCPKLTNPADFFMKLMNESGLLIDELQQNKQKALVIDQKEVEGKLQERVKQFVTCYKNSPMPAQHKKDIYPHPIENKNVYQVSWIYQFLMIINRAFKNEIRNPMNLKTTILQVLFVVFLVDSLYYKLDNGTTGIQDRTGVLFLLASMSGFTAITGSIGTFSQEKPVFIRERMTRSYSPGAYFWGRAFSELPFLLFYPLLLITLVYWVIELNDLDNKFLITVAFHVLTWLAGSAYGLLLSTIIPRLEFALAIVPALIVPFLILTGFFVNQNNIPFYFKPLEYISIFKWAFQGTAINEFTDLTLTCTPICDPLEQLDFQQSMSTSMIALAVIGIVMRILAYIGLVYISTPKKAKILRPAPLGQSETNSNSIEYNNGTSRLGSTNHLNEKLMP